MMNHHEQKVRELMGEKNYKPYVSFFDHAAENAELTEASGRPRFVERVYIQKIPSAPDIPVRDVFTRAKTKEDEREYPEEWAAYCERKEAVSNLRPPIAAIPGMDVASKAELLALNIRDCEAFVNHPEPLDELEPLRATAKRIMEISNGIREGRQVVQDDTVRPIHHPAGVPGSGQAQGYAQKEGYYQETGHQEAGDEEESFTYQFQVSM
jgi:hypothetical protein